MAEEKGLFEVRLEKRKLLEELGVNPYPTRFDRNITAFEIHERFDDLVRSETVVSPAGRLMTIRRMGKASFAHLQDRSGRVQLYFKRDVVGDEAYGIWKKLEPGDLIGVSGVPFRTKSGEISLEVRSFEVLAKTLIPLPEKWHGLTNRETRYRQRHVDLVVNQEVLDVFVKRAKIIRVIRSFLDARGFLEVETPVLQPIYGGAAARPFLTHHNALDLKLYLRIADELYLKRLIVGGCEKVYEIAKDFRNEGIDRTHNPEFTQLELYEAYSDYNDIMALVEELMRTIAFEVNGNTVVTWGEESADLAKPWKRVSYIDALSEKLGRNILEMSETDLRAACVEKSMEMSADASMGAMIDKLFEVTVEPELTGAVFVVDFPKRISPLAKEKPNSPGVVERFEPYLFGMEIGNAFSELNDPIDQRERFEAQKRLAGTEGGEAHQVDEDFLRAIEFGMPPTGGLGIGIDRITMVFTNQPSIRDVLLFPQLRSEATD